MQQSIANLISSRTMEFKIHDFRAFKQFTRLWFEGHLSAFKTSLMDSILCLPQISLRYSKPQCCYSSICISSSPRPIHKNIHLKQKTKALSNRISGVYHQKRISVQSLSFTFSMLSMVYRSDKKSFFLSSSKSRFGCYISTKCWSPEKRSDWRGPANASQRSPKSNGNRERSHGVEQESGGEWASARHQQVRC